MVTHHTAVALAHTGGPETNEYDGKPGQQRGGFRQTQWLLLQLGCLLAHQVIGWEAWSTLGYLQQDFCLQNKKVQVETPSCLPHATVPAASTGMLPGEGRSACEYTEFSGFWRALYRAVLGTCPARELREKETAPQPARTCPEEGLSLVLTRRRGCSPNPWPVPFHWLKVVKVRRCVRVRRNLLVLPSSTRRVNAFMGDSAFGEHQSPSHPLPSWLGRAPGHP